MTTTSPLMLDLIYAHEKNHAQEVFLTQPLGKGQTVDYTWAQTLDQARRMATYLQTLGLPRAARIAIPSA